jgi:gas vesicle protein
MKKTKLKKRNNIERNIPKIVAGLVVGSVVGATVGWLTAPASGVEIRRRIMGKAMDSRAAQERAKTAARNVESQARDLAAGVNRTADDVKNQVTGRNRVATPG